MIKLKFELCPQDGRIKPYDHPYGYVFRGVIMKWLHEIKPELVHELHLHEKVRPYSINYIVSKKMPMLTFVLVAYQDDISDALINDLISGEKSKLTFGQKDYHVSSIQFERINPKRFLVDSKPVSRFRLNFLRPVYFNTSMGDFPVRFPIPVMIFGNLARIWNQIVLNESEIDVSELQNWVNAHVFVSSYKMRTASSNIGKPKPVVGGLGNASYSVSKINRKYYVHLLKEMDRTYDYEFVNEDYLDKCRWLETLCALGELTNVGANRTAAMGVMRYYPKRHVSQHDLLSKHHEVVLKDN